MPMSSLVLKGPKYDLEKMKKEIVFREIDTDIIIVLIIFVLKRHTTLPFEHLHLCRVVEGSAPTFKRLIKCNKY